MPFAVHRGLRLFYELSGVPGAPAVLLIRGLARSSRYWFDLRPRLEGRCRLLVMDNRGVGQSDAPGPGFDTADMADDVAAVLAQSGVGRAHVFGISLGGMVAQRLAIRHPARVDRLVLAATTMGGPHAARAPFDAVWALLRAGRGGVEAQMRSTAPWVLSPDVLAAHPEIVDRWVELARSEPRHRRSLLGQLLAGARHDASRDVHRIEAPTLVLTGDADRLIPMGNSLLLAGRIPGARLEVLPGGGHDFPTEQPDEVASILGDFFGLPPAA